MWELLKKNPKFIAGSIVVGIFVIMGVVGPMVTRDPLKMYKVIVPQGMKTSNVVSSEFGNWTNDPMPPGTYTVIDETSYIQRLENGTFVNVKEIKVYNVTFILGTTQYGMDVFAQLCAGIRNSLFVGAIGGVLGTLIAVLLGALGAYKGGLADETSNVITNIVMVFPTLPALLVLASLLDPRNFNLSLPIIGRVEGRSFLTVGMIIALTSWPWAARCIRSQVLSLKEREFIGLAKMSGMRSREIVIKEVLPNMLAYIIMVLVLLTGGAMLAEAWLSVLGLGPGGSVTLGNMIYSCTQSSVGVWRTYWWWWIPPGALLAMLLSAVFVMHAGMDEVFNPRLRRM